MSLIKLSVSALAIAAVSATAAVARDQVQVTGSSTVLPYSTIVAEAFGENFDFPTHHAKGHRHLRLERRRGHHGSALWL